MLQIYFMKRNEQKQNRKRLNSQKNISKLPPLNKKAQQPEKAANLGNISHQDEGIVGLLYQYFIKNNFLDSLDSFQRECFDKGFKANNKTVEGFRQELVQAFQHGNRQIFMNRFQQFVPISMRSKDLQTMKLQFYIQVYFFVYSIHPQLGKKRAIDSSAKQAFIAYLEGRGAALAKSTEFMQYYALAYLQKPHEHPTFKSIFTREWIGQLKKRVIYFIEKLYPVGRTPMIITIYDKFIERNMEKSQEFSHTEDDEDNNYIEEQIDQEPLAEQENARANHKNSGDISKPYETDRQRQIMSLRIAELEEEKNELIKFIESMKNKQQTLQNKYKQFTDGAHNILMQSQTKWFKITQEFYNIASNLLEICMKFKVIEGQQLQPLTTTDANIVTKIQKKLQKYESFIHMNIEDLISQNIDFSMFQRPDYDASTDLIRKNPGAEYNNHRSHNIIQINFEKVKQVLLTSLKTSNEEDIISLENQKCDLLEALKWRIIKTRGIVAKRQAVLSVVLADLFNFSEGENILSFLLSPAINNTPTNTSSQTIFRVIQLLNALAKDYYGRQYLTRQSTLTLIIDLLKSDSPLVPQKTKELLILTLQQLSIKSQAQIIMINKDIIAFIIRKLKNQHETMTEFLMLYCTALLINLLLRKEGCAKSEEIKEEILQTLINLMEFDSTEVREYVHGTLYPLFSKKVFRDKAKEYGMEENIKYLLSNTDVESLIHQLNYLKAQLMREDDEEEAQGDGEQDTDDITDEEYLQDIDIEGGDFNKGLTGEDLLLKKYSLTGPDAISQLNAIREETQNTLKKKSVYMANSFSDRPGTNNPVLQMRRNPSHNNSVYSNKSSNRILRSELNNRSQLHTSSQNRINNNNGYSKRKREKLDTVQPDNSDKEMSIKDFINENNMGDLDDEFNRGMHQENRDLFSAGNNRNGQNIGESRQQRRSGVSIADNNKISQSRQNKSEHLVMQNESFSQSRKRDDGNPAQQPIIGGNDIKQNKSIKTYQQSEQYQRAFQTRARCVRTPPQKK